MEKKKLKDAICLFPFSNFTFDLDAKLLSLKTVELARGRKCSGEQ